MWGWYDVCSSSLNKYQCPSSFTVYKVLCCTFEPHATLWGRYYYSSHFIDRTTETIKVAHLGKVRELASCGVGVESKCSSIRCLALSTAFYSTPAALFWLLTHFLPRGLYLQLQGGWPLRGAGLWLPSWAISAATEIDFALKALCFSGDLISESLLLKTGSLSSMGTQSSCTSHLKVFFL